MNALIAVFLGGGLGSLARFSLAHFTARYFTTLFPWATLLSNILACGILALAMVFLKDKFQSAPELRLFIVTGFCGGFSTFSAFSYETFFLWKNDHPVMAFVNIIVSLTTGIGLMFFLFRDAQLQN